ncbi:MAG TPA: hypothetical protein VJ816_10805, partial [Gemmatimonadales bacterium]|nr:hypothetical protein [Gemmatimonadales bacterium]
MRHAGRPGRAPGRSAYSRVLETEVHVKHVERDFAGRALRFETGRLAKQAAGSCLVQYGETVVLATVTVS